MSDSQTPQGRIIRANTIPQARAVLSLTPARWLSLAETVPNDLLTRPPKPGEWSAAECLRHILDTERWVFPVRIRAILAGQDFAAFNPGQDGSGAGEQTIAQLAAEYAHLRAENLALLARVTEDDLSRTARHSELGVVTMAELINEWAAHDLMHTVQAERSLMQPFIIGSGPWRAAYFSDHDAEAQK
ncbi:MAG TPA: DinB family protein [Ktedonobacterales bacterium]|nr:DinB family protein [Ktedonobacterales bacterium]